ncbi:MAG: hypothetical protein U0704_06360 [Candidatus Eisenbacteria bacterium]
MNPSRVIGATLFVVACVLVTWLVAPRLLPGLRSSAPAGARALPSLREAQGWLQSEPLAAADLPGAPAVLVLWSDTDPAALAALPVLEAWKRAWSRWGVRVIAVHEPEYAFAADTTVPARLVRAACPGVPVALDPAGRIALAAGGMTEAVRVMVADEGGALVVDTVGTLEPVEDALAAWFARAHPDEAPPPRLAVALPARVRTVELGSGLVADGPLARLANGAEEVFVAPLRHEEQGHAWTPYPVGGWRSGREGLTSTRAGAANFVAIRYSAGRAGVVLSPPDGASARVWVLRNDQWPRAQDRDADVRTDGHGAASIEVRESRLYWFDRGSGERVVKLSPDVAGVTIHAFVFTDASGGAR